jgi:tetrahydromethanopterin S-methyltransferase subunit F
VTLGLRPGAGVENELSAQLGVVSVFQMTLAPARPLLGIRKVMSDISDHAAMVIRHNRLIGGLRGSAVLHGAMCCNLSAIVMTFAETQNKLKSGSPIRYSIRNARLVGNSSGAPNG